MLPVMLLQPVFSDTSTPYKLITKAKNLQVWQRFDNWLMITEDLEAGRVCYYYSPTTRTKLSLKDGQAGQWAPLGSAIKWLMYIDNINGLDRLISHDVDNQIWHITRPSTLKQVGCAMAGNICYFGEYRATQVNGVTPVDLYAADVSSGGISLICASDTQKSQFAHDGNLLVYMAQYPPGINGICGHYLQGTGEFLIRQCDAYEPSVCGNIVAWAQQVGSSWTIMGMDLSTGDVRTIAVTSASPPRPEAGRNSIFWQDARNYTSTGIDIYGYDWLSREEFLVTNAAGDQYNLRVCDDLVTWVSGLTNYQTLWIARLQPPEMIVDLRPEGISDTHIDLAWTAIGTTANPAVSYEVRISDQTAITNDNWEQSSLVSTLETSAAPGSKLTTSIDTPDHGYYYVALRGRLASGEQSPVSNCIRVFSAASPNDVLGAQEGSYVGFQGTVTGIIPDNAVYLQSNDVLCVRVVPAEQPDVNTGDTVCATGILKSDERFYGPVIWQADVSKQPANGCVKRYAMSNKSLGGSIAGLTGASNVWMPVKVWGRVSNLTLSNGCSFVISDGSLPGGVQVISPYAPPANLINGMMACVEGICTVSRSGSRRVEIVGSGSVEVW